MDSAKIDGLITSLAKFSEKLVLLSSADSLFADWSKEYGPTLVFRKLWESLNLHKIISDLVLETAMTTDVQEAVFCMVLNRLSDPASKLGVNSWKEGVCREEFDDLKLHNFYRAIDFLDANKEAIENQLYFRNSDLFTQMDLVFFDTTSTYVEGGAGELELLNYGYSKDHRPDRLQVIIGVLMTRDGIPIAHHVFPGNTSDTEAFKSAIADLKRRFNVDRVIVVGDRGMMGAKTLEFLAELEIQYILGARMRSIKIAPELIADPAPYIEVPNADASDDEECSLKVKAVNTADGRYIVCLNEKEAKRDKEVRARVSEKLRDKLAGGAKGLVGNREFRRYLRVEKSAINIDEEKLKSEEMFDGIYIIQTDTDLEPNEVATTYKSLWQIERAFRKLKTTIELRPMYHRKEYRISGHIMLCFLALVMQLHFQKKLKESGSGYGYTETIRALKQVNAVKLKVENREYLVRTDIQGAQAAAFRAVGAKIPERALEL
jgi:transposase